MWPTCIEVIQLTVKYKSNILHLIIIIIWATHFNQMIQYVPSL